MRIRLAASVAASLALFAPASIKAQGDVVEITPAVLDRFLVALAREASERQRLYAADPKIQADLALGRCMTRSKNAEDEERCTSPGMAKRVSPEDQWHKCLNTNFPDVQRNVDAYEAASKKGDAAAMKKAQVALQALQQKATAKCGNDPSDEETDKSDQASPESEKAREAIQAAAEERREAADEAASAAGSRAGKFTARQYAILRERVIAYVKMEQDQLRRMVFKPTEIAALRAYKTRLGASLTANE